MPNTHVGVRRRVLKGLSANIYGQFVVAAVQLIGVPILLHAWGTQAYGEWLILFAVPGFLSMTDLGFSLSAANDMSQKVARANHADALQTFLELWRLVYTIAVVGLVTVTLLLFAAPLQRWIHFTTMSYQHARLLLWFLLAETFVRLTDGVNHAGFRASGEYGLHMAIYWTAFLAQYIGIWVTASLGYTPLYAAFVYFSLRCLITPAVSMFLLRRHRWLHFGGTSFKEGGLRSLARPASANVAIPLAQAINIQGIVLVIGALLGPVAVVTFSSLRTLTRIALQMALVVSNATEPELAMAFGGQQISLLRSLFVHSLRASLWLALAGITCLILLGPTAFQLWTHGKVPFDKTLFLLMLGSSALAVLWYTPLIALKAANLHMPAAILYLVGAGACVLFAGGTIAISGWLPFSGVALVLMDSMMVAYTFRAATDVTGMKVSIALRQAIDPIPLLRLGLPRTPTSQA